MSNCGVEVGIACTGGAGGAYCVEGGIYWMNGHREAVPDVEVQHPR